MRFVNTVELKNQLNAVLTDVRGGEAVVVTLRGKPAVALLPTSETELEQMLFERGVAIRRAVEEGLRDLAAGRVASARDYADRRFGKKIGARRKPG